MPASRHAHDKHDKHEHHRLPTPGRRFPLKPSAKDPTAMAVVDARSPTDTHA